MAPVGVVLFLGIPVAASICYALLRGQLVTRRLRRIAAARVRAGDPGRREFLNYCSERGLPPNITREIYDYLQRYIAVGADVFPVRLNDTLYHDLKIDRHEIDLIIEDLADICQCGVQWDKDAAAPSEPTVRDLLELVLAWRDRRPARPG